LFEADQALLEGQSFTQSSSPKHQTSKERVAVNSNQGGTEKLFKRLMGSNARSSVPRYPAIKTRIMMMMGMAIIGYLRKG
jgi:hypothetical protein